MGPIICLQPAAPNYDALPTYKITYYPLEKRDYMPYAQAQVCLTPAQLVVRMWAFEAFPRPDSRLEAVFAAPDGGRLLIPWVRADGAFGCLCRAGGRDKNLDCLAHAVEGEDLQGVYWGIAIALDRDLADRELGRGALREGGVLPGNFYKLSDDPDKPHQGAMAPTDFTGGRRYAPDALTPFQIVRY